MDAGSRADRAEEAGYPIGYWYDDRDETMRLLLSKTGAGTTAPVSQMKSNTLNDGTKLEETKMNTSIKKIVSYVWPIKIKTIHSELNGEMEVWLSRGKYILDSAHTNYSFGSLHKLFQMIFLDVDPSTKSMKQVLLLGLGAGSVVSILKKELKMGSAITAVEHDPVVIDLGKEFFNLNQLNGTKIVQKDAYDFVMKTRDCYDMVIIDLFRDEDVPEKFAEPEFLEKTVEIMNPKGVLIYNFIVKNQTQKARQTRALWYYNSKFGYTKDLSFFGSNKVIICRK
jgi:spermidine synthase